MLGQHAAVQRQEGPPDAQAAGFAQGLQLQRGARAALHGAHHGHAADDVEEGEHGGPAAAALRGVAAQDHGLEARQLRRAVRRGERPGHLHLHLVVPETVGVELTEHRHHT